ncbi:Alcohol dehydrogenase zinc-binding domain protein [Chloroherpeton thalassium ATCC 35110]|uniref:Alcohol dehydrogenase zinc-binding domain protein n=1 Tax=Chloroherpeton thalassium (strain ATCC 35110 / GB-78) TaxID=517418 RepID=B3QVJ8_CHLT3|nr:bi-domain-containing oxidoreductase [Chloroherpeton thalassium]ACF14598.1 Alcohol dehydrogenase zinc-binding domain protein [Chloroherpeton thalassium ATCC 35110]
MKQIIQSFKTGETILEEVPAPQVKQGTVLIKTAYSLVSLGTERMLVEFGKSNLLQKARQQPDKVNQVLDKMKTDGVVPTLEAVFNKLGEPLPLGYCNVGEVIAVGQGVSEFKKGDRVASNGPHAEFVCVPKNLVAGIPSEVSYEEAAFTVIGSIGLQGIRLCNPTFGETIVVTGLGLIGLLTAQMLLANGCNVIGIDFDASKLELAKQWGIQTINPAKGDDPVKVVMQYTNGIGADGVIITASTKSNEVISQAAQMSRKRGRIVLVGVIGLDISRADFYEKELSFQVSCSYGPGRYDDNYEQKGQDYPIGFVRWTEKRNFDAILQAIAVGKLNVKPLITEVVELENYLRVYGDMKNSGAVASLLKYQADESRYNNTIKISENKNTGKNNGIAIIGAGNFTKMTVLPAFKNCSANLSHIVSSGGVSGTALAKKFGIVNSTTDYHAVLKDENVNTVMITTRHNLHASMTVDALQNGKNVFVEKPLALNNEEYEAIKESYKKSSNTITVGFNRRFSPFAAKMKSLLGVSNSPIHVVTTMNAGAIPSNVWVHDLKIGGGRIVGEACHFIDLITFLTGSKVISVCMTALGENPDESTDNATILLKYENGSNGVINYFANGSKSYDKERVEVYSQERTLILQNWRKLTGFGFNGFTSMASKMDKGHEAQFRLLTEQVNNGGPALIPFEEIENTTKATFAAIQSLKEFRWIAV